MFVLICYWRARLNLRNSEVWETLLKQGDVTNLTATLTYAEDSVKIMWGAKMGSCLRCENTPMENPARTAQPETAMKRLLSTRGAIT